MTKVEARPMMCNPDTLTTKAKLMPSAESPLQSQTAPLSSAIREEVTQLVDIYRIADGLISSD
ncbi:MAG: hypothetical protein ABI665_13690 [Vicinamibacterales bacterium]